MPFVREEASKLSRRGLERLRRYVLGYALSAEVREDSREAFYALTEELEGLAKNANDAPESNAAQNAKRHRDDVQLSLMREILEENIDDLFPNLADDDDGSDSDESLGEEAVNDNCPRVLQNFGLAEVAMERQGNGATGECEELKGEKDSDEKENRVNNGHAKNNNMIGVDGNNDDYDAEADFDDEFCEMQAAAPYLFMSRKKKKAFFRTLSTEFSKKVKIRKSTKGNSRVKINVSQNKVLVFAKSSKIGVPNSTKN